MLKTIEKTTWEHRVDKETYFLCRPHAGPLMSTDIAREYFGYCILEAHCFTYKGKDVKCWKRSTGTVQYMNGKEAYVGMIPWHEILPDIVATNLMTDLMVHSRVQEDERKN